MRSLRDGDDLRCDAVASSDASAVELELVRPSSLEDDFGSVACRLESPREHQPRRLPLAVLPSRSGAPRFPGKPLHRVAGRPMVVRVLERALLAKGVDLVLVATDDERIARAVESAGGTAVMTDPDLPSGTDRVYAAV